MRDSVTNKHSIGRTELIYFLLAAMLLLLMGALVKGQTAAPPVRAQIKPAIYREFRGVRLGMTAAEARAILGEPVLKSDEQDYYVFSSNETTQIGYDVARKVMMISTDYSAGVGAPDYRSVVGEGLLQRPDGSVFRMVMYESERFWVSYNRSAATVPVVTITIGIIR
jgi:hypothetical protein